MNGPAPLKRVRLHFNTAVLDLEWPTEALARDCYERSVQSKHYARVELLPLKATEAAIRRLFKQKPKSVARVVRNEPDAEPEPPKRAVVNFYSDIGHKLMRGRA